MSPRNQSDTTVSEFILRHVESCPKEIVTFTANHFGITRQATLKHVRTLVESEKLGFSGTTRNRIYSLKKESWYKFFSLDGKLHEDQVWSQEIRPQLGMLPDNVLKIWSYGFTEMLNNAIDHSEGSVVVVSVIKNAVWQEGLFTTTGSEFSRKSNALLVLMRKTTLYWN